VGVEVEGRAGMLRAGTAGRGLEGPQAFQDRPGLYEGAANQAAHARRHVHAIENALCRHPPFPRGKWARATCLEFRPRAWALKG